VGAYEESVALPFQVFAHDGAFFEVVPPGNDVEVDVAVCVRGRSVWAECDKVRVGKAQDIHYG